jgi:MoaA/NifB/PqqE/SkfB family radical SAM enzyme
MCPPAIRYDKLGQKRDPYYRLTLAEYKKITDGVKISSAHFVGAYAEPLLNKEIFDLIGHAKSLGAFTAITSNGLALSRPFAAKLLDAGLDMITISLHGATKSVAETIMLKSDFDRIISNIRGLQDLKRERRTQTPIVYFNYVAQRANVGDIPAFIELSHSLGVHNVNLIHLIDGDPAVDRATNLEHLPDVLCTSLEEAVAKATSHGISLSISPALLEIQKRHHQSLQHPVSRTQANAA